MGKDIIMTETLGNSLERVNIITNAIINFLSEVSSTGFKSSSLAQNLKDKLNSLFVSLQLLNEAMGAISSTAQKSKITIYKVLSQLKEVVEIIKNISGTAIETTKSIGNLKDESEKITSLLGSLEKLNSVSLDTARNAEIKAYHSGIHGKGFEIVAMELSKFTSTSSDIVNKIMSNINSIDELSKSINESIEKINAPVENIQEIFAGVNDEINLLNENFKNMENTTSSIKKQGENEEKIRTDISGMIENLIAISQKLLLNSNRANFVASQKESMVEILMKYGKNILPSAADEFGTNDIAIEQLQKSMENFIIILKNIEGEIKTLEILKMKKVIESEPVENLEIVLRNLDEMVANLKQYSENSMKNNENIEKFIIALSSIIDDLEIFLKEIRIKTEETNDTLSSLKKMNINILNIVENLRILSLYAKLEAARAGQNSLMVIVEQMENLTDKFKGMSVKLNNFVKIINREFRKASQYLNILKNAAAKGKENVEKSSMTLKENKENLNYMIQITEELRQSMSTQRDLIQIISSTVREFSEIIVGIAYNFKDVVKQIDEEKKVTFGIIDEIKSFALLEKKHSGVLKVDLGGDPITLDPAQIGDTTSNKVAHQIYRGLFEFGLGTSVFPSLIEEMKLSDNTTRLQLKIKRGIKDHSGRNIGVDEVVYSLKRVLSASNAFFFDAVKSIEAAENQFIEIELKYPYIPIFANLATIGGSILPEYSKDFISSPVGTGPFRLLSWERTKKIVFEPFEEYVLGSPFLERLEFIITDKTQRSIDLFREGIVDIANISLSSVVEARKNPELSPFLTEGSLLDIQYLGFNFQKKDLPFSDKKVRQAMNFAVDRTKMIKNLDNGLGTPANGIFPPAMDVYNPHLDIYSFNPEKAMDLLNDAGYPNGLPDTYLLDISDTNANIKRGEYLIEEFKKIGINIELNVFPWKEFLERIHKGKHQLFILGWSSDNGDPDNFLYPLFHSKNAGDPGNNTFYNNAEVDKLIEEGMREINPKRRIEIYRKAEEKIVEDAPWVFLYHGVNIFLVRKNVQGFIPHPLGFDRYNYVRVK